MSSKTRKSIRKTKRDAAVPAVVERIEVVDFLNEFGNRYRDYALYVIMDRSLPDVRDGMKPVHRRTLYAMHKGGYSSSGGTVKCARIVGDVIGKYHPHGDTSVYDALVRMAQDWTYRYPLVTPQGNFGSIDGDRQAAMRYTEAKLSPFGELAVNSALDDDGVDFTDNYDGKTKEPVVLPVEVPYLLLNSISGIAVGIATDFVPHNLTEVLNTCIAFAEYRQRDEVFDKDAEVMRHIKGPDFPTGGILVADNLKTVYSTGHGKMTLRARIEKEEVGGGRWRLVVTEMPYGVSKQDLIISISEMIKAGNSKGRSSRKSHGMEKLLSDIYDETENGKIRIVMEPRSRKLDPEELKLHLYSVTNLQTTIRVNMNALIDGGTRPRQLSFAQCIDHFLDFREEVETRRARNHLAKVEARLHILEGLIIAYLNIDEVVSLIRNAEGRQAAKDLLREKFELSEAQADAIVNLRLYQLQRISETEIKKEMKNLKAERKHLVSIIEDRAYRLGIMVDRFREIIEQFGDKRRTTIERGSLRARTVSATVIIDREPATAVLTDRGWVKHIKGTSVDVSRTKLKDGDKVWQSCEGYTTDHVAFISKQGRVFTKLLADLPPGRTEGAHLSEFFQIAPGDEIIRMVVLSPEQKYFAYNDAGYAFKILGSNLINSQKKGKQVFTLPKTVKDVNLLPIRDENGVLFINSENKIGVVDIAEFPELPRGKGVQTIRLPRGHNLVAAYLVKVEGASGQQKIAWPSSARFSFDDAQIIIDRARAGLKQQARVIARIQKIFAGGVSGGSQAD
ncbi:MAG: DNA topoisomerase IV subunit A [Phototrophicales bacterium]|nr:MAG: DNA topoisomerase IV subunit A [Phototrophicales bacterium]